MADAGRQIAAVAEAIEAVRADLRKLRTRLETAEFNAVTAVTQADDAADKAAAEATAAKARAEVMRLEERIERKEDLMTTLLKEKQQLRAEAGGAAAPAGKVFALPSLPFARRSLPCRPVASQLLSAVHLVLLPLRHTLPAPSIVRVSLRRRVSATVSVQSVGVVIPSRTLASSRM